MPDIFKKYLAFFRVTKKLTYSDYPALANSIRISSITFL